MQRVGKGALAGCLGVFLLAGQLSAKTVSDTLFREASSLVSSAQKVEQESFSEAYQYYKLAIQKMDDLLSKYPASGQASQLSRGKLKIGGYTYIELKENILPQAKRKAEAENDPIEAILLLIERKADGAYLEYALNRIIRIYRKQGHMDKATEVAVTRTPIFSRPRFLMNLAFDYAEHGDKKKALALLEKAITAPSQPLKEVWQIDQKGSNLAMIASAYIRLEAPDRARPLLDQALSTASSASLLAQLAAGYANLGETDKADAIFARAKVLKKPGDAANIALYLAEAGRYDEAGKMLEEVEPLSMRVNQLVSLYGTAIKRGDDAAASKFFNEALDGAKQEKHSDEENRAARQWLELASSAREAGEMKWAVRFLERVEKSTDGVVANPSFQESLLLLLAEEYWKVGETDRIGPLLGRFRIRDSMGRSTTDQELPTLYARIGKIEEALQLLENYEMGDGKVGGRLQVANVLWEKGNRDNAMTLLAKTESEFKETVLKEQPEFHYEMIRLASQYDVFGEKAAALRVLMEAEKMALLHGGPFGKVDALTDIARCYIGLHQIERATVVLSKALDLTEQMNDRWEEPQLYGQISSLYAKAGHFDRALEVSERIKGNDREKGAAWLDIAVGQLDSKQLAAGRDRLAKAVKLLEQEGALENPKIAEAWLAAGEIDRVFSLLDQDKNTRREIGLLSSLADSYLKAEMPPWPEASVTKLKLVLNEVGNHAGSSEDSVKVGSIWAQLGDHKRAEQFFSQAEAQMDRNGLSRPVYYYEPLQNIAYGLISLGQPEQAVPVALGIKEPSQRIRVLSIAVRALLDQKKKNSARSVLSQMEEIARGVSDPSEHSDVLLVIAGGRIELGESEAGLSLVDEATAAAAPTSKEYLGGISIASVYLQAGRREKGMGLLEATLQSAREHRPNWAKVIELGEMTFPLAEAGEIDQRSRRFLHMMLLQAEDIPSDPENTAKTMRPSPTFNAIVDAIA
jgi:tetratricopeptide (TPR) repeat protein